MSINGAELAQHTQQPCDVLRRAAMHDVEIARHDGRALEDARKHPHHDYFDVVRGEHAQDFIEPRAWH